MEMGHDGTQEKRNWRHFEEPEVGKKELSVSDNSGQAAVLVSLMRQKRVLEDDDINKCHYAYTIPP